MKWLNFLTILTLALGAVSWVTCRDKSYSEPDNLSELALKGKQIFESKECGQCHYVGDEAVASEAPDLLNPFLANDSLFVQAHLKFVEMSKMPPVDLTEEEIRLVSHYVAELFNANLPPIPKDEIDTYDPVCYAPVSSKRARAQKLSVRFRDKSYYFASEKTLDAFTKAPEAFVVLYEAFLAEKQKDGQLGKALK